MKKIVSFVMTFILSLLVVTICGCDFVGNNSNIPENSKFGTAPEITAAAQMGESVIGYPTLEIVVTNNSDKDIAAIRFYIINYDVYGKEINNFLTDSILDTDTKIVSGDTEDFLWQFLEQDVKMVKLFVYSVYYTDGSEWGDKDAIKSEILKNAPTINVSPID